MTQNIGLVLRHCCLSIPTNQYSSFVPALLYIITFEIFHTTETPHTFEKNDELASKIFESLHLSIFLYWHVKAKKKSKLNSPHAIIFWRKVNI